MFQTFYTTAMCPQRRALEKRFCNIRKSRFASKSAALTGILFAVLLFGSSVFASGMMQDSVQNPDGSTLSHDETLRLTFPLGTTDSPPARPLPEGLPSVSSAISDPAKDTVTAFFAAFAQRNFTAMKQYCTESFVRHFFYESEEDTLSNVWGMKSASLTGLSADWREYMKSSDDFRVTVTAEIENAVTSSYYGTARTFTVCLLRQPDGRYLIDRFE